MTGAQYAARFAFPSKIVFNKGRPKANVLCDVQKVAAIASSREKFKTLELKNFMRTLKLPMCNDDNSPRRAIPCDTSIPSPFVKALQNAFQTRPMRMYYSFCELTCEIVIATIIQSRTK